MLPCSREAFRGGAVARTDPAPVERRERFVPLAAA
jgi:hypothetical protein